MPADAIYLNTNIAAYHWNRDRAHKKNYNERNTGIGIEQDDGKLRKSIGYYHNSLSKYSFYASVGYVPLRYDVPDVVIQAGFVFGVVTGYTNTPLAPMVGGLVSFTGEKIGANLMFVPGASNKGSKADGFAGLQLRYKLE